MSQSEARRILIVEDNAVNLKLFHDVLANEGYEVCAIEDGAEAEAAAAEFKPELVLLDIQLNELSGIDVLKKLKHMDELNQPLIAAVTAFAMPEDKEKFLSEGFDHYITKPISIGGFLREIKAMLEAPEVVEE